MPALANVVINALYISNNSSSELAPTAILSTYNAIQKQVAFKSHQLREVAYLLPALVRSKDLEAELQR
jgi:hypothetical protein